MQLLQHSQCAHLFVSHGLIFDFAFSANHTATLLIVNLKSKIRTNCVQRLNIWWMFIQVYADNYIARSECYLIIYLTFLFQIIDSFDSHWQSHLQLTVCEYALTIHTLIIWYKHAVHSHVYLFTMLFNLPLLCCGFIIVSSLINHEVTWTISLSVFTTRHRNTAVLPFGTNSS